MHVLPALAKGGAERVVVVLANEAHARGHEVRILAGTWVDPTLVASALHPDIEIVYMFEQPVSKLRRYLGIRSWLSRNRGWLLDQDIVHCHLTFGTIVGTMLQRMRGSRPRPKVVETFHGVGMPVSKPIRLLAATLAPGRDGYALMAMDDYWRGFIARHPKLPLAVIPNGIPGPPPAPSEAERLAYRREAGIPPGAQVVGNVGRLVDERLPDAFPPIFAAVARQTETDVRLLMAGEGPALEPTRRLAIEFGVGDRVHFPGFINRPELALANTDVYLSINMGPITGIAGLEAAAFGVPVVAIQTVPGHAGEADWIWSSADPASIAAEVARLLRSPSEREALSARQRAHVAEHYSAAAMADAYETLYRSLLGKPPAGVGSS